LIWFDVCCYLKGYCCLDTKPLEHMYDRWSQVADTAVCSHQTSASLCFRSWPCTSEHLALVGSVVCGQTVVLVSMGIQCKTMAHECTRIMYELIPILIFKVPRLFPSFLWEILEGLNHDDVTHSYI